VYIVEKTASTGEVSTMLHSPYEAMVLTRQQAREGVRRAERRRGMRLRAMQEMREGRAQERSSWGRLALAVRRLVRGGQVLQAS
jgi:hypothetical protein